MISAAANTLPRAAHQCQAGGGVGGGDEANIPKFPTYTEFNPSAVRLRTEKLIFWREKKCFRRK